MQMQCIATLADENSPLCERNSWGGGIADVCKKNTFPDRGSLSALDVMNVQHHFWETFVKHAGLDLKRNLGAFQLVLKPNQRLLRTGREVNAVSQSQNPCGNKKDRENTKEMPDTNAAR